MLLEEENAQLQQAVGSHAVVDQALGVLIAVYRLPPEEGWRVLVKVSQHLNVKLHAIADEVIAWALGRPVSGTVMDRLDAQVHRRSRDRPGCGGQAERGGPR
ncbi:ANTAR domain-containing protein [Streptomyces sp. NPDC127066]|uniref:ANTAR domain-containing protein n=1 Tax=Streptomyces sp. NPDC127066 TaxID=3347125 RepID=UPI00365F38B9